MTTSVPDLLSINHRADLGILVVRWLRHAEAHELHQGYHHVLDAAIATQCRFWLLDARRRRNTDKLVQQWMLEEFLPQVSARLAGRAYLGYLLAPVPLRDTESDQSFPAPEFFADKPYQGERFIDEGEAVEWLRQRSLREVSAGNQVVL